MNLYKLVKNFMCVYNDLMDKRIGGSASVKEEGKKQFNLLLSSLKQLIKNQKWIYTLLKQDKLKDIQVKTNGEIPDCENHIQTIQQLN